MGAHRRRAGHQLRRRVAAKARSTAWQLAAAASTSPVGALNAAQGGALGRDEVETFVEHTLHSRACQGVVPRVKPPLSTATDYSRLRISELRALLASREDRCEGCVEKGDFVAALRGHAAAEAAAGGGSRQEEL